MGHTSVNRQFTEVAQYRQRDYIPIPITMTMSTTIARTMGFMTMGINGSDNGIHRWNTHGLGASFTVQQYLHQLYPPFPRSKTQWQVCTFQTPLPGPQIREVN